LKELIDKVSRFFRQEQEIYGAEVLELGLSDLRELPTVAGPGEVVAAKTLAPVVDLDVNRADRAHLFAEFAREVQSCTKCPLARGRKQVVFGTGNASATLMFVGEGPGREEDLQGLPFVGPAGKILDRMIAKVGFTRDEVYIANVVKCRPPGNRNPAPEEVHNCLPYLEKQIKIIRPRYIICLGRVAVAALLNLEGSLARLRGKVYSYAGTKVFVTYHPAALLRTKKLFWDTFEDLKLFRRVYDAEVGDKPSMETKA